MSNRVPYEKTTRGENNEVTMSTTQIKSSTKLGALPDPDPDRADLSFVLWQMRSRLSERLSRAVQCRGKRCNSGRTDRLVAWAERVGTNGCPAVPEILRPALTDCSGKAEL
jgi:hypothetical protein